MRHRLFLTLVAFIGFIHCGAPQDSNNQPSDASPGSTQAVLEKVDTIRIGAQRAPDTLNPYLSTSLMGEIVAYKLFPTLFLESDRFEERVPVLEPYLVANFSWDETGTQLTLTLGDNLTWQDGTPLTTADVDYSLGLQTNKELAWLGMEYKSGITGWEVLSPSEMKIGFKASSPYNLLDLNEGFIVPKHHFSQWPISEWQKQDWQADLVTFGPYKIGTGSTDERLFLEGISEDYPNLAIAFIRDKETLYQLLSSKELDYAWQLPVSRIPKIRENLQPIFYPNKMLGYIAWNPILPEALKESVPETKTGLETLKSERPHPVLADKRVRQALTLAMNRQNYNERFWHGESFVPATPWQAGLPFSAGEMQTRNYDPDAAAKLLDEAGWRMDGDIRKKDGIPLSITVLTNLGSEIRENYLLAIQADLKKIGIEFQVESQEPSLYFKNMYSYQFDGIIAVIRLPTRPDLRSILHSDSFRAGMNLSAWLSGDFELDAIRDANAMAEIVDQIGKLEAKFHDELPMTILYAGQTVGASSGRINPKPTNIDPLDNVESWQP